MDTTKTEDIKRKVQGLIRLGQSNNAQECQAAISKARELMRKYRIAEHEVITEIEQTVFLREVARALLLERSQVDPWHKEIANASANVCGCVVLAQTHTNGEKKGTRHKLWAVGIKAEVALCHEMYDWLLASMQSSWSASICRRDRHSRDAFYSGFSHQMLLRSQEEKNACSEKAKAEPQSDEAKEALIILKDKSLVENFISEKFGRTKEGRSSKPRGQDTTSYQRGREAAKETLWKPTKALKG